MVKFYDSNTATDTPDITTNWTGSLLDYIENVINVDFTLDTSAPQVTKTITNNVPGGFDGYTQWTYLPGSNNTLINHADIYIKPTFAAQDFLNLHEFGRVLGLVEVQDVNTTPDQSVMITEGVVNTNGYTKAYLDTIHAFGTQDIANLLSAYGTADQNITGTNGNDIINGYGGNDTISALMGQDTLNGNAGNDVIHGGKGFDLIHGGQNDDVIYGDLGNDAIYGDLGNDRIVIQAGNMIDTIFGFTHGQDIVEFSGTNLHSFSDVQSHSSVVSGNTVITLDAADIVTLSGFTGIVASDFIFS